MIAAWALVVLPLLPQDEPDPRLGAQVVQVRAAAFTRGASRRSEVLRKALYGEEVAVTAVEGRFSKVTLDGAAAYIPTAALVAKEKFVPAPENEEEKMRLKAQAYEAGRFDPETEKAYRKEKGPALDAAFKDVDALERRPAYKGDRALLERRLEQFRRDGKLGEFSSVR
jgi:hypothetical protein